MMLISVLLALKRLVVWRQVAHERKKWANSMDVFQAALQRLYTSLASSTCLLN